jgi:calpain-7
VYNPCGKYMVVLRVNGVPRKVVIDDYLPLDKRGNLLCSYSSNSNELWISLLEKAYMKVMGGYDFPGSNSNIDLYALTGWIPERVMIRPGDPKFDKEGLFKKLHERFHRGDVLVTLATGEMSETDADRAGLVPAHAYAILDVKEVDGVRLFLVKNPWSHLRWRGNYSEIDTQHWTPDLMKRLNYDPKNARNFDNGVFWIDYDSLCKFFDVLYMNWNPALFKHTYAIHHVWKQCAGPAKDLYNISSNPQYSLELAPGSGALWILLSRHITDIEDFKDNREYITVLIYKNDGKRVYYPYDPPPYIDGVRINSPLYLCQTIVSESMPRKMTLVVSQYEKSTTIFYTLRVYSTLPFSLKKISDPYKTEQKMTGAWKEASAGGCQNYKDTYVNNPRYQFTVSEASHVLVEMKGPKQFQIGFDLLCVQAGNKESPHYFKNKTSGAYRTGFVAVALELTAGTYDITPTTFRPGEEGPFFLTVKSSSAFKLARLK